MPQPSTKSSPSVPTPSPPIPNILTGEEISNLVQRDSRSIFVSTGDGHDPISPIISPLANDFDADEDQPPRRPTPQKSYSAPSKPSLEITRRAAYGKCVLLALLAFAELKLSRAPISDGRAADWDPAEVDDSPGARVYRALGAAIAVACATAASVWGWSAFGRGNRPGAAVDAGDLLFGPVSYGEVTGDDAVAVAPPAPSPVSEGFGGDDDEDDGSLSNSLFEDPQLAAAFRAFEAAPGVGEARTEVGKTRPRAPHSLPILSCVLDMSLLVSGSHFLYVWVGRENDWSAAVPVLTFFVTCGYIGLASGRSTCRDVFVLIWRTVCGPIYSVTFRDGFIGDVITSTVRPLQDVAFTLFYCLYTAHGWLQTSSFAADGIDVAAHTAGRSWVLNCVILPACTVSPLWWRFLQCLRQSYETKKRWPYLGNAFKYFVAAQVAMFGVFDPSRKRTFLWLSSFVAATLYQVWWDTFMDWDLLVVSLERVEVQRDCDEERREKIGNDGVGRDGSSARPTPVRWLPRLPQLSVRVRASLRPERLYQHEFFYWGIFFFNFVLRFGWTLGLMPAMGLTADGRLVDVFPPYLRGLAAGPALAVAEIVRRTMWGLIRVENEAITRARAQSVLQDVSKRKDMISDDDFKGMLPMSIGEVGSAYGGMDLSDMSASSDVQILTELTMWAAAFVSMGMFASAS